MAVSLLLIPQRLSIRRTDGKNRRKWNRQDHHEEESARSRNRGEEYRHDGRQGRIEAHGNEARGISNRPQSHDLEVIPMVGTPGATQWDFLIWLGSTALPQVTGPIDNRLSAIESKLEALLATEAQYLEQITRLEAATTKSGEASTAIGVNLKALVEVIKNSGMTAEKEAEVLARITALAGNAEQNAAALDAMAKDPNNTVPVEPPPPLPA
jgi:hypothetical protein